LGLKKLNQNCNMNSTNKRFGIAIHGGAGTILKALMTKEKEAAYNQALQNALDAGYALLESGKSSLDAVEAAVRSLEDFPLFNAGKGAVFTHNGTHEMDASIMFGADLSAGAVSGISSIRNPVSLARVVMEKSGHVYLSGVEAENFGKLQGLVCESPAYFYEESRYKQLLDIRDSDSYQLDHTDKTESGEKKFGTVGAVALDAMGNLAAATSTGGMTNKRFGRVGDTPIIGAGTYANNKTCAISCTGHGEYFIRAVVAYDISCLMEYRGMSLEEAARFVVNDKLVKFGGEGGLVGMDADGNYVLAFNSEGMYRGIKNAEGINEIKIYES